MEAIDHPYLEGVKCREDGAVFVPQSGANKAHWTFGHGVRDGYLQVIISKKHLKVHRLICEAFHGLCPEDKCQVDHIDRNPANNTPENLRWCSRSENNRNRKVCEESLTKYGVSSADDNKAYKRAYHSSRWRNDPEFRERHQAYMKEYRAKKKGKGAATGKA